MKTKTKKFLTLGGAILTLGVLVNHLTENPNVVEYRVVIIRNIQYELPNFETTEKENDGKTVTEMTTSNEEIVEETASEVALPDPMDDQNEPPIEVKTEPIIVVEPVEPERAEPYHGQQNDNNQVYVLGFGWIEKGGENICYYAEDMYTNGNKVGIM